MEGFSTLAAKAVAIPQVGAVHTIRLIHIRKETARAIEISGRELAPFGQGARTVMFENISAIKVAFVIEKVVGRGMDGGDFLEGVSAVSAYEAEWYFAQRRPSGSS